MPSSTEPDFKMDLGLIYANCRMLENPSEGGAPAEFFADDDGKKKYAVDSPMSGGTQYGRAKMALVADTIGLARKYPGINFTSQQPGSILSNFVNHMGLVSFLYYYSSYFFQYSPSQGAVAALRAALDPDFNSETDLQGAYLHADGNPWYPDDTTTEDKSTKQPYTMEAYGDLTTQNADKLVTTLLP